MSARPRADVVLEPLVGAAVLVAWAWLGAWTGWKGPARAATSTAIWPFYLDTWFHGPVFTVRAALPLVAFAFALLPLRRFVRAEVVRPLHLAALIAGAYVFHVSCGLVRHGFPAGLTHTLSRAQEYWSDVRFVRAGFLAAFPDQAGLSMHGATHPPGYTLVLAGVQALVGPRMVPATLLLATLASLSAWPLLGTARRLADEAAARWAVVLLLFSCVVTAFAVLSMDMVALLLAVLSLRGLVGMLEGSRLAAALFGLAFALASLCSFTTLMLGLSYGAILLSRAGAARRQWRGLLLAVLVFVAFYAVLCVFFSYRPFHVLAVCWSNYAVSEDHLRRSALAGRVGNPVAFLGELGLPLMGLSAHAIGSAVRPGRDVRTRSILVAAVLPVLACLLLGTPQGEVEHVLLPFVPLVVLGAAAAARNWYHRGQRWLLAVALPVAVLQSVLIEVFTETLW